MLVNGAGAPDLSPHTGPPSGAAPLVLWAALSRAGILASPCMPSVGPSVPDVSSWPPSRPALWVWGLPTPGPGTSGFMGEEGSAVPQILPHKPGADSRLGRLFTPPSPRELVGSGLATLTQTPAPPGTPPGNTIHGQLRPLASSLSPRLPEPSSVGWGVASAIVPAAEISAGLPHRVLLVCCNEAS